MTESRLMDETGNQRRRGGDGRGEGGVGTVLKAGRSHNL